MNSSILNLDFNCFQFVTSICPKDFVISYYEDMKKELIKWLDSFCSSYVVFNAYEDVLYRSYFIIYFNFDSYRNIMPPASFLYSPPGYMATFNILSKVYDRRRVFNYTCLTCPIIGSKGGVLDVR